jgi:hypothetical protein
MSAQGVRRARVWGLGAVLLAGLMYSVLAVTLSTPPVYASSCDCNEAAQDAAELCWQYGRASVEQFYCPLGGDMFGATCSNGFFVNRPCTY